MSKGEKYLLAFIWSAFIVRGVFYSTITPLWEGFDEWSHFAFIQYAQVYHHLPTPGDSRISREIEESFPLVPMPWVLRDMPGIQFTHDTYWRLPAAEQRLLEQHLRHIPREWIRQTARNPVLLYEAQQPPLFYYLFFWPPVASANMPLPERVFLLRYANVILTSFLIPIAYLSAFFVFGDCRRAVGLTAVIAAVPGLGLSVSRVANEGLSIVMCSALLYLLLRVPEECRNFRFMLFLGATVVRPS